MLNLQQLEAMAGGLKLRDHFLSEYNCFNNMNSRCYNPLHGADNICYRGVEVFNDWKRRKLGGLWCFECFLIYMQPKPSREYDIDRIDGSGDYTPGNVQWLNTSKNRAKYRPSWFALSYRLMDENQFIAQVCWNRLHKFPISIPEDAPWYGMEYLADDFEFWGDNYRPKLSQSNGSGTKLFAKEAK